MRPSPGFGPGIILDELIGELLTGVFRVLGEFLSGIVVELLVRVPGYLACRMFRLSVNPDGFLVLVVGLAFWGALLGGALWFLL